MSESKFYLIILCLVSFLSFNANAETSLNSGATKLYRTLNALNTNHSQHSYQAKRVLKNEPRIAQVKLGMVFTPEDLVTISAPEKDNGEQVTPIENRETIIAFYFQTFF